MHVEISDKYDREFLKLMIEIEKRYETLIKADRLRLESWCKLLCMVTNNIDWKKNRNLHAIFILDMILNNKIEEPYNKFPFNNEIPFLSKIDVKIKLTDKIKQFLCDSDVEKKIIKYSENYNIIKNQAREKAEKLKLSKILLKNSKFLIIFLKLFISLIIEMSKIMQVRERPCCALKPSKYVHEIDFDQGNDFEENLKKLKFLAENLKEEIKIRDYIIIKQNEEKMNLEERINLLENEAKRFILDDNPDKKKIKNLKKILDLY